MTVISINNKEFTVSSCSESEVWKVIGKQLSGMPCPSDNIEVKVDNLYTGYFKVAKRGTWTDDNGKIHPSRYITMTGGNLTRIPYTSQSTYSPCYLACIHPQSNNYKAYYLEQRLADGRIVARYESIDKFLEGKYREVKDPYPSYMYWVRYYEKISKGYIDQSEIYFNKTATQPTPKPVTTTPTNASEELYALLYNYALKRVEKSLTSVHVTVKQVKTARKIFKKLGSFKTVRAFNKHLQELLILSPRKRDPLHDDVADFLARDKSDMARIIMREEDLLNAMEVLVKGEDNKGKGFSKTSFKDFGVEVFEANDKQRQEVLDMLSPSVKAKVGRIWRIKPLEQEKRFAEYCKKRGIKEKRKFCHGSRNENWSRIIEEQKLQLRPQNVVITGKMFGIGSYYGPDYKAVNYTSLRGSTWARGNSDRGFMGIFATAYGNPLMVKTWGGDYSNECKSGRYDCVHATPRNTGLKAEEVIFYDEDATCLNYLVELCA